MAYRFRCRQDISQLCAVDYNIFHKRCQCLEFRVGRLCSVCAQPATVELRRERRHRLTGNIPRRHQLTNAEYPVYYVIVVGLRRPLPRAWRMCVIIVERIRVTAWALAFFILTRMERAT
jgi:hypothetical protein